jgi:hypothetical protein
MNILNDMIRRLTDNYKKDSESNIGKLLNIVASELEDTKEAINKTGLYRDIDQAAGATLDRIGLNVQQFRGQATDPVYRILIKSKISRNLSDGSINTLIRVLSITLDINPNQIQVRELWQDATPEPAALFLNVPSESLNAVGFSLIQFGRLVNRIVAAGVKANVLLQGTFSFSSIEKESEFDEDKGFTDLDQIVGGYLGTVYDPANDPDLPL